MKHPLYWSTHIASGSLEAIANELPVIDVEDPDWQTAADIMRDAGMTNEVAIDLICNAAQQAAAYANVKVDTKEFREVVADMISDLYAPVRDEVEKEAFDAGRIERKRMYEQRVI